MRGAGGGERGWPELVAGALVGMWRWRVELALLALPALGWRLLARPLGELAAGALVAWAVAAVLVSPRPRARLLRWLHAAQVRRSWVLSAVLVRDACAVVRRDGVG